MLPPKLRENKTMNKTLFYYFLLNQEWNDIKGIVKHPNKICTP